MSTASESTTEHLDVVIVGAGLSGIGTACHLTTEHPQRSYAVLEARDDLGGTWSLFQSIGANNPKFNHLRKTLAAGVATVIVVGNVSFPILTLAGVIEYDPSVPAFHNEDAAPVVPVSLDPAQLVDNTTEVAA